MTRKTVHLRSSSQDSHPANSKLELLTSCTNSNYPLRQKCPFRTDHSFTFFCCCCSPVSSLLSVETESRINICLFHRVFPSCCTHQSCKIIALFLKQEEEIKRWSMRTAEGVKITTTKNHYVMQRCSRLNVMKRVHARSIAEDSLNHRQLHEQRTTHNEAGGIVLRECATRIVCINHILFWIII